MESVSHLGTHFKRHPFSIYNNKFQRTTKHHASKKLFFEISRKNELTDSTRAVCRYTHTCHAQTLGIKVAITRARTCRYIYSMTAAPEDT